ncbi:hypothetical protein ACVU7I_11260 [Patulibacter sp. S7RM1-6]
MSFFDDDDFDEPTHIAEEPRRGERRGGLGGFGGFGGGGGGSRTGHVDPKTARQRQITALAVIVVVLILLVLAVNGCVKSGKTNALRDYSRDVTSLLDESRSDVAVPMFRALSSGAQANAMQSQLNRLRTVAESNAKDAAGLSAPGVDGGKDAQHDLEVAMNFRARAVRIIAERIPAALADEDTAEQALSDIAGQMQAFVASDVLVLQRTKPLVDEALADRDVSGLDVRAPRTVTNFDWLNPDTVGSLLAGGGGGSSSGSSSSQVRDRSKEDPQTEGTHGTGITGVSMGGTTLADGDNAVSGRDVTVNVTNQGTVDESNIDVGITFTPEDGKAVSVKKTIQSIGSQEGQDVQISLPSSVRSGASGELKVQVGGVPGEQVLDNNTATYDVTIGG